MRTRYLAVAVPLIAAVGCAGTTGGRSGLTDRWRTIVTANGTRQPAETGPPGAAVAAALEPPEPRGRAGERISGRVVDAKGRPVPGAEVRLADGGARSGRDVRDTTDAAGGFTLGGLRPGETYTLIAEIDDGRGPLVGRSSRVEAPESGLRIRLRDAETAEAEPEEPERARVGRASSREDLGDAPQEEEAEPEPEGRPAASRPPRINIDDLPPAEEAEALDVAEPKPSPRTARSAWRRGNATSDPSVETVDAPSDPPATPAPAEPAPEGARPEGPKPPPAPVVEDDGPNPLPPAKERPIEPGPKDAVPAEPAGDPSSAPEATSPPSEPKPPEPLSPEPKGEPRPDGATPEAPPAIDPPASPDASPAEKPVDSVAIPAETAPRRRPTWRELTEQAASAQVASTVPISTRRLPAPPGELAAGSRSRGFGLFGGKGREAKGDGAEVAVVPASCRFDAKKQRIVDFRLPGLDGNPVRFQEIDADFILIDFWGTWCKPCRDSIPRLVDLQTRYGPKTLRVVGVATEHGSAPAEQARNVDAMARSLGINYPVLLSELDGKPCPLQEALHVQAYPTMVLVDRTGRILWRGTGAETTTLARLDRVIAARADSGVVRR